MATQSDQRSTQNDQRSAQSDQRPLAIRPNEQSQQSLQKDSSHAAIPPRRGSSLLGFGISPQFSSNRFSLMRRMTEEMDRVIHEFRLENYGGNRAAWSPAIEVSERDGQYSVRAELPGLSPDDARIEVVDDNLVIQGERKVEHEEKDGGVQRTERQYGFFYRSIPLPEGADTEHANAKFQNGMLEVTIPVPQQKENRRPIRIEGQTKSSQASQSEGQTRSQTSQTEGQRHAA